MPNGRGLDLAMVADAIAPGQAASPQVVRNTRRIVEGNHDRDVVFTPALRLKDARLRAGACAQAGHRQLLSGRWLAACSSSSSIAAMRWLTKARFSK